MPLSGYLSKELSSSVAITVPQRVSTVLYL